MEICVLCYITYVTHNKHSLHLTHLTKYIRHIDIDGKVLNGGDSYFICKACCNIHNINCLWYKSKGRVV
jgi:hypothetical protein